MGLFPQSEKQPPHVLALLCEFCLGYIVFHHSLAASQEVALLTLPQTRLSVQEQVSEQMLHKDLLKDTYCITALGC